MLAVLAGSIFSSGGPNQCHRLIRKREWIKQFVRHGPHTLFVFMIFCKKRFIHILNFSFSFHESNWRFQDSLRIQANCILFILNPMLDEKPLHMIEYEVSQAASWKPSCFQLFPQYCETSAKMPQTRNLPNSGRKDLMKAPKVRRLRFSSLKWR